MSETKKIASCTKGFAISVNSESDVELVVTSENVRKKILSRGYDVVEPAIDWIEDENLLWPRGETGLKTTYKAKNEIDPLLELTDRRSVVVQAGGACGLFPKYLARHFQWVYSFEPNPQLFEVLCANAYEHNIFKFPCALVDRPSSLVMATEEHYLESNMGAWWVNKQKNGAIPGICVDSFHFDSLDLLILDIEGGEYAALKGAENNIRKHHPVIHVEHKDKILKRHNLDPGWLHEFLTGYGYTLVRAKRSEKTYV